MREPYPEITPFRTGLLEIGGGKRLYWEECGNPQGKPVVFLHGGPGSGCSALHRRLFDPSAYRIVLFDQRGCGRSTPHAGSDDIDLSTNTTWHLVADIERLREHLGVEQWQVFGGSWGSALALAYAETHPERVTELVLHGVCTYREAELAWAFQGASAFLLPDRWEDFLAPLAADERPDHAGVSSDTMLNAYHRLLHASDAGVRENAVTSWLRWGAATVNPLPEQRSAGFAGLPHATALARIELHYFRHHGFFTEGQLLADAPKLGGITGVIVQGRYDVAAPPATAWELSRAWPESTLHLIEDSGHAITDPGILDQLLDATDSFVSR